MVNGKVFLSISLVIGIGGLLTIILVFVLTGGDVPFDYGVVIDAGSSHTQLTTYKWEGDKIKGTGLAWQVTSCKVEGGLASSSSPEESAKSLIPCLQNVTGPIPSEKQKVTPLVLGATAGMRLLNISNYDRADALLIALGCVMDKSGLDVKKVDIISGEVEGLSAWITANFLTGIIQNKAQEEKTIGALDLGGASTQISFEVPAVESNVSVAVLKLYGLQHRVYSRSYLCFGANEAYRRYAASLVKDLNGTESIVSPCLPKDFKINHTAGYLFDHPCTATNRTEFWFFQHLERKSKNFTFEGSSDAGNCRFAVKELLNKESCRRTYQADLCFASLNVTLPSTSFLAFSSFYYTASFINSTNSTLTNFENETEVLCQKSYDEVKVMPTTHPELLSKFCFQANFIEVLLVDGYGFDDTTWSHLTFIEYLNNSEVSWSLGYMINVTNAIPEEMANPPAISLTVFILLFFICAVILLVGLVFFRRTRQSEATVYETI